MANLNAYSLANLSRMSRATLWATALTLATLTVVYIPMVRQLTQLVTPPIVTAASVPPKTAPGTAAKTPTIATPPASTPASLPATVAIPTPQSCSVLTFGQPSQLGLSGASTGLTTRIDAPTYYQIYGYTADQLRNQIQHCAPGAGNGSLAEFTGETNYSLNWAYKYTTLADGSCTLDNIKVGMHTATALPTWQTNATTPGLADRWTQFSGALATHEQGHMAIDKLYAAKLVTDLTALPAMGCSQLASSTSGIIQNDVTALNQANAAYDLQTNHGAMQGAILPS